VRDDRRVSLRSSRPFAPAILWANILPIAHRGEKPVTEACVVMTTAPNPEVAQTIAMTVLQARLAACVQVQAITSYYWWDGKINDDAEQLLLFKTTKEKYSALEQAIVKAHPYDTPEILQVPVEAGFSKYLAWMAKETV
jgi:periplasmic divalent cation tolerance protein